MYLCEMKNKLNERYFRYIRVHIETSGEIDRNIPNDFDVDF